MDPTALPTDNLYKFMALSGLGVAGFCLWFWWTRQEYLRKKAVDSRKELSTLESQIDARSEKNDKLRGRMLAGQERNTELAEQLKALKGRLESLGPVPDAAAVKKLTDESDKWHHAIKREQDAQQALGEQQALLQAELTADKISFAAMKVDAESIEDGQRALNLVQYALVGVASIGLLVSVLGFGGWYLNVQWYADRLAKADFEDHMAELADKARVRAEAAKERAEAASRKALPSAPSAPSPGPSASHP